MAKSGIRDTLLRDTPKKIYSEIIKLLDNKNIRLEFGDNGNKWIKNNLDVSNGIETYISTYQNLMKQKKQQFLPLRYAFYGFIITLLGKFKGYIRKIFLSIKLYKGKEY